MNARNILNFVQVDLPEPLVIDPSLRRDVLDVSSLELVVETGYGDTTYGVREAGAFNHPDVEDLKSYYEERLRDALRNILTPVEIAE
jgi:hypothetical protein